MKFWDTSAVVPLLMQESQTTAMARMHEGDPDMLVWWGTAVECTSAIARIEREAGVPTQMLTGLFKRLTQLADDWHEIQPVEELRAVARRLLRVHPLRAADAFQLAAAFLAAEKDPLTLGFVCLDQRLSEAARKEGFTVFSSPPE